MDTVIRQAERNGEVTRAALLRCKAGQHWWSNWQGDGPRWKSQEIYQLLGVSGNNPGVQRNQTSAYQKYQECFWCRKKQRRLYVIRWGPNITGAGSSETVAEIIHEV